MAVPGEPAGLLCCCPFECVGFYFRRLGGREVVLLADLVGLVYS